MTARRLSRPFLLFTACLLLLPAVARSGDSPIRNFVFLISDDLKASVLGCYGDKICDTPNIDRLAAESMVFDRAYCQGVVCAPSRKSLMFSRYQGKGAVNMGQFFKQHGLYSARVGKIYHMKVPGDIIASTDGQDEPSSWTEKFNSPGREAHTPGDYACLNLNIFTTDEQNRQSTAMPHRMFVSVQYDGSGADQPDHKSATKAIELLQQHHEDPFFLAVGLIRPHYPMVAPRQYFDPYPWQDMPLPAAVENDLEDIPKLGIARTNNTKNDIGKYPDNQKRMWAAYYASVSFMDAQVGRILAELDRLKLRDSTAIVFCSDHGYHLGEHGFWQKSNLHEEVTRVPLMMSVPGMTPGRSQSLVELVDIFPTLAELSGFPAPAGLDGRSLVPLLRDPAATVKDSTLSFNNGYGLRTSGFAYARYRDASEELYDMQADPEQFTNLALNPRYKQTLDEHRLKLRNRLKMIGLTLNARLPKR